MYAYIAYMYAMYASDNTAPKCIKQKRMELKGERVIFTIIVGNANIPLSVIGRTSGKQLPP